MEHWNSTGGSFDKLRECRVEKACMNVSLTATWLSQAQCKVFVTQLQEIEERIKALEQQQKQLRADASAKQKALTEVKAALKKIHSQRNKV